MTAAGSHDEDTPTVESLTGVPHVGIFPVTVEHGGHWHLIYRLGSSWPAECNVNIFDLETFVLGAAACILLRNGEPELAQLVSAAALDTDNNSRLIDSMLRPVGEAP